MPPLSSEQLDALRSDIEEHGVLVPITVDQNGRILDGNNRAAIAEELGIECPRVSVVVADDDAAVDLALTLNCARRHLTQDQKRDLIRSELARRPGDSDRAISRRIGCSPTTVGAVRKTVGAGDVSNLDGQASREEAEERTAQLRASLDEARAALFALVGTALTNHISVTEVLGALTMARLHYQQRGSTSDDAREFFLQQVYDYVIQVASWPETAQQFPPHPDAAPTPEDRQMLIDSIAMMGIHNHPADLASP